MLLKLQKLILILKLLETKQNLYAWRMVIISNIKKDIKRNVLFELNIIFARRLKSVRLIR